MKTHATTEHKAIIEIKFIIWLFSTSKAFIVKMESFMKQANPILTKGMVSLKELIKLYYDELGLCWLMQS